MSWLTTSGFTASIWPAARRRRMSHTAAPVTNIASVASMNGAPRMAPTPTSPPAAPPERTMAMNGIIVSGRAVPTAASTEPIAPSLRLSFRPNHSMPLVNSSAPKRMTANETTSSRMSNSASGVRCVRHARPALWGTSRPTGAQVLKLWASVLRRVRQEGDDAGALECHGQLSLVARARAGLAARLDLGAFRKVAAQPIDFLVVNRNGLVRAERAHLAATAIAVVVVSLGPSLLSWVRRRHGS